VKWTPDECTDPVNNSGCDDGEKCIALDGSLICRAAGDLEPGSTCDKADDLCQAGSGCLWSSTDHEYKCREFCNLDTGTGCTNELEECVYLQDEWGMCL
jgi:hypothetical protein